MNKKQSYYLSEYTDNVAFSISLQTFSPQHVREVVMPLLQPDIEGQSEPHPMALMPDHIIAFVGSNVDNVQLEESLSQPNKAEFIKAVGK